MADLATAASASSAGDLLQSQRIAAPEISLRTSFKAAQTGTALQIDQLPARPANINIDIIKITSPQQLLQQITPGGLTLGQAILDLHFDVLGPVYNVHCDPSQPRMVKHAHERMGTSATTRTELEFGAATLPRYPNASNSSQEVLREAYNLFLNGSGFFMLLVDRENNQPIGMTCAGLITEKCAKAKFTDGASGEYILGRLGADAERPKWWVYFTATRESHRGLKIDSVLRAPQDLQAEGMGLYKFMYHVRHMAAPSNSVILMRTDVPIVQTTARTLGYRDLGTLVMTQPVKKELNIFTMLRD